MTDISRFTVLLLTDKKWSQVHNVSLVTGQAAEPGDHVKVCVDIDTLEDMQEGHGGWNSLMAKVGLACMFCLHPVSTGSYLNLHYIVLFSYLLNSEENQLYNIFVTSQC